MKVTLHNFASYRYLEFELSDDGLNLISGSTGSGKSTLCDAVPWILFGRTSKDGSVDEIRSWGTQEKTSGVINLPNGIRITRTRAPNDLFYTKDEVEYRGKDLNDTQRLINQLLGYGLETYLAGSYYHEFSQTAQFFTLSAKNRRQLCEQIADLGEVKALQEKLHLGLSEKKLELTEYENLQYKHRQSMVNLMQHIQVLEDVKLNFETSKQHKLEILKSKQIEMKAKLLSGPNLKSAQNRLSHIAEQIPVLEKGVCVTCGNPSNSDIIAKLRMEENELSRKLERNALHSKELRNIDLQITEVTNEVCLSDDKIRAAQNSIKQLEKEDGTVNVHLSELKTQKTDAEVLLEILDAYRSAKISNAISQIQTDTNQKLSQYFDAEIRVQFAALARDKVDVEITKDGNLCSYTQLSKGQRCILKLCFGTSVMQAAQNQSGINFDCLWFDEALDGMDSNMKLCAMKMLANLPQKCKYIVEHNAPDEIEFNSRYNVRLTNGESQIEKA